MLSKDKIANLLKKVSKAAYLQDSITIDNVTFYVRVLSKREADTIDALRSSMLDSEDMENNLTEYVSLLKRDTLAFAICQIDDEILDVDSFELEDGKKVDKYHFMSEEFLPSLTISTFDRLYELYMELFRKSDEKSGRKVDIVEADTETEIDILKKRLEILEADRKALYGDDLEEQADRQTAKEQVFTPIVTEPPEAPQTRAEAVPPAPPVQAPERVQVSPEFVAEARAQSSFGSVTMASDNAFGQYSPEFAEQERLYQERLARQGEKTRQAPFRISEEPLPSDDSPSEVISAPLARPRLTAQHLNPAPKGNVNPHYKGHKP